MNKFNPAEMREKYNEAKPLHPLANVFPWIEEDAFNELVDDIHNNGLQQKIVTFNGSIIDGKNRELACLMAGRWSEDIYKELEGSDNLIEVVASLNLHRRHLNESQRAMIANQLWPEIAKQIEHKKVQSADSNSRKFAKHTKTAAVKKAAEMTNVSARTVNDAEFVEKHGTPEQIASINVGDLAVSTAVKQIKASQEPEPAAEELPVLEIDTTSPQEQTYPAEVEKAAKQWRVELAKTLLRFDHELDVRITKIRRCINPLREEEAICIWQLVISLSEEEMRSLRRRLRQLSKSLKIAQEEQQRVTDTYHPLIAACEAMAIENHEEPKPVLSESKADVANL